MLRVKGEAVARVSVRLPDRLTRGDWQADFGWPQEALIWRVIFWMQTRDCRSGIDRQGIGQRIDCHTTFLNAASKDRNRLWGLHAGSAKSIVLMERIQKADRRRAAARLAVSDAAFTALDGLQNARPVFRRRRSPAHDTGSVSGTNAATGSMSGNSRSPPE
ncbi:hypothetical protein [Bradyrhizobium elkanii]|uniref:hypothetical protein n=1 Tax=Bradyrhizobium elkanii TaxID=29448 RepID=UPI00351943D8